MMQKRSANIELLRIIAMLFIITGHFLGDNGGNLLGKSPSFSLEWFALWAIEAFCVSGTNCFVLISGYFLIDSIFRWKKVLGLCTQVWFYAIVLYFGSVLFKLQEFDVRGFIRAVTPILGRNWWFISTYLGLYILSPYLSSLINNLSEGAHRKLVIIAFVLFSVIGTLYPFSDTFGSGSGSGLVWFSTLFIIAAYIRRYPERIAMSKRTIVVIYFCLVILIALSKYAIAFITFAVFKHTYGTSLFYTNTSFLNLGASVMLFLLFKDFKELSSHKRMSVVICSLGGVSFDVYMLHNNLWTSQFMWERILTIPHGNVLALLLMVLVIPLIIYVICGTIGFLRKKLFSIVAKK